MITVADNNDNVS